MFEHNSPLQPERRIYSKANLADNVDRFFVMEKVHSAHFIDRRF